MIWETGRPVRRNMGPNNARCVVWALGEKKKKKKKKNSFILFDNYQSFVVYLGYKLQYTKQGDK